MPLDEVLEAATIKLPEPLDLKKAEELLHFIASEMPAEVRYDVQYHMGIYHSGRRKVSRDRGSFHISGTISSLGNHAFEGFETLDSIPDHRKISAIRFSIIPGHDDLNYYPPATKALWESTRIFVSNYFKEKFS